MLQENLVFVLKNVLRTCLELRLSKSGMALIDSEFMDCAQEDDLKLTFTSSDGVHSR